MCKLNSLFCRSTPYRTTHHTSRQLKGAHFFWREKSNQRQNDLYFILMSNTTPRKRTAEATNITINAIDDGVLSSPSRENAALALSALFHTAEGEAMAKKQKKSTGSEILTTARIPHGLSSNSTSAANIANNYTTNAPRKDKSLGTLCENFITKYEAALIQREAKLQQGEEVNTPDLLISIDAAAAVLGVERRRIYDIINILESLEIVFRKCKNTYVYKGRGEALTKTLGELQEKAIGMFPDDAVRSGICS